MDFNTFLERFALDPSNFRPHSAELIQNDRGFYYYYEQETSHVPCPYCGSMTVIFMVTSQEKSSSLATVSSMMLFLLRDQDLFVKIVTKHSLKNLKV